MDFHPSDEQAAIVTAVRRLLEKHAGPARAIELDAGSEYDHALEGALAKAGFEGVARGPTTGALEAALVLEEVARQGGVTAFGAAALVAPGLLEPEPATPVALAMAGEAGPIRYAAHAHTLLVADGDFTRVVALSPGQAEPVRSKFGYPFGRIHWPSVGGERLGPGTGSRLLDRWRVALAVEAVGTMRAALDLTLEHVKTRRQFGRAIGSFQALQHRLAACHVWVEGSRWLALNAAWSDAQPEAAALAAAHAMGAAAHIFSETHQLSGAMGFTKEHDLHVFSMRLQALRLEMGGVAGHRVAAARARWGGAA